MGMVFTKGTIEPPIRIRPEPGGELVKFCPVRGRLVIQHQKLAVGKHQAGGFRPQTFLHILRGGGHGRGILAKAFPRLVKKLGGIEVFEKEVHLVNKDPCIFSLLPVGNHAILSRPQRYH